MDPLDNGIEKKTTRDRPCGILYVLGPYPLPAREAMTEFHISAKKCLKPVDTARDTTHCAGFSGRGAIPHRRYPASRRGARERSRMSGRSADLV